MTTKIRTERLVIDPLDMANAARRILVTAAQSGLPSPIVIMAGTTGEPGAMVALGHPDNKEQFLSDAERALRRNNATWYVIAFEAWYTQMAGEDSAATTPEEAEPKQSPIHPMQRLAAVPVKERKEAIFAAYVTQEGSTLWRAGIVRSPEGDFLDTGEMIKMAGVLGGRMTTLLGPQDSWNMN